MTVHWYSGLSDKLIDMPCNKTVIKDLIKHNRTFWITF
jgi:hypothetical protein